VLPFGARRIVAIGDQPSAKENIIAQDQADTFVFDEILANDKGVCQAARLVLLAVFEMDTPLRSIF
jgi:hypothetical protein